MVSRSLANAEGLNIFVTFGDASGPARLCSFVDRSLIVSATHERSAQRTEEGAMTRKKLDLLFSVGGLLLAVLLLVLGLVLQNQASFAKDYVHDQLSEQKITFTPADKLGPDTQAQCLKDNGGKTMSTGKQAECYANEYIKVHVEGAMKGGGYEGGTYATVGGPQRELAAKVAELTKANPSDPAIKDTQAKLDALNALRETAFKGETLRGLLLTSYGFSIFGERAGQAALLAFLGAAVLLLASIAGFLHGASKKADHVILGGAAA
jgi:hypothetical protein